MPSNSTVPASGESSCSQIWMVVVLPAPFGPRSPKHSPARTSRSSPSTATTSLYALRRPCTHTGGLFGKVGIIQYAPWRSGFAIRDLRYNFGRGTFVRRNAAIIALAASAILPDVPALAQVRPVEEEIALGRSLAQEMERHEKILPDAAVAEYIARLAGNTARNAGLNAP